MMLGSKGILTPAALVDASEIDLSVVGTQFGGKGGPGEGKDGMEMQENKNRLPGTEAQAYENLEVMSGAAPADAGSPEGSGGVMPGLS